MPGGVTDIGGTVLGGGFGLWGISHFIRWLVEFICKRQDIRSGRLDEREKALEAKFNGRLADLENEVGLWRTVTMRLLNRMAEVLPHDPVLSDVATILHQSIPLDGFDADLERLARQARRTGE